MKELPFYDKLRAGHEALKHTIHVPEHLMIDYVNGATSRDTSKAIDAHIKQCPKCQDLEKDAKAFLGTGEQPIEITSSVVEEIGRTAIQDAMKKIRKSAECAQVAVLYEGEGVPIESISELESDRKFVVRPIPGLGRYVVRVGDRKVEFLLAHEDLQRPGRTLPVARGARARSESSRARLLGSFESEDGALRVHLLALPTGSSGSVTRRAYLEVECVR